MIRHLEERDYDPVITVIDEWWGGRKMSHLLPRIFFIPFRPTSFAVEDGGSVIGFLAGFVSQTNPEQAYIHFVGIHPVHRRRGLGRELYKHFFNSPGPGLPYSALYHITREQGLNRFSHADGIRNRACNGTTQWRAVCAELRTERRTQSAVRKNSLLRDLSGGRSPRNELCAS